MNNAFQSARVGLFFVLGIALIYVVYEAIGFRGTRSDNAYTVRAVFNDLKTLAPGADVRIAGVRVGSVGEIALADGQGRASLLIDQGVDVPADSVARIQISSLLGQNYVAIEYGSAAQLLADGNEISTAEMKDLNDIMADIGALGEKLNRIADSFGGGEGGMLGEFNTLLSENRDRIDSILANMDEITAAINDGEGTLGRLIKDDSIYEDLSVTVAEFKSAATEAQTTFADARQFFEDARNAEGLLNTLIFDEELSEDMEVTLTNFRTFSEKMNDPNGTLGLLMSDDSIYRDLKSLLEKADTALDSLNDTGPVTTAVGAAGTVLF